ncbi:hypothetical protein IAR50_000569 [Cryptococcus sp. DSM 104548]
MTVTVEKQYKNIVIIGASIAGHNAANELFPHLTSEYRILLVEALPFAFWPLAAIRAATVPGWENKITVPLTQDRIFPAGSQHRVLAPNKLLECKESSVVLEHPFEGSNEVPFWRCVVATGAKQEQPMVPDLSSTEEEYKQLLRQFQKGLKEVKDVVIIGGGTVGIEFAGDIRCVNEKAKITIVHPNTGLLEPTPLNPVPAVTSSTYSYSSPTVDPRLSKNLEAHCRKLDIELVFQDRVIIPKKGEAVAPGEWEGKYGKQEGTREVVLKSGKKVKADWVIMAAGTKPNSWMVGNKDEGALDGRLVRVDEYLKITSTNKESIFKGQYYAVGDVCNAPGFKAARGAGLGATTVATNIKAEINKKAKTKFSTGLVGLGIPVGHDEAAGMVTLPLIGNVMLGGSFIKRLRGNAMLIPKLFVPAFKGPTKVEINFDDV